VINIVAHENSTQSDAMQWGQEADPVKLTA
jgi:hypothetical protein